MTELSWFNEPDSRRTGSAPPPDTLVALLELPRTRRSPVNPLTPPTPATPLTKVAKGAKATRLAEVGPVMSATRLALAAPPLPVRRPRRQRPGVPVPARIALVAAAGLAGVLPGAAALLGDVRAERPGARLLAALLAGGCVLALRARRPYREPDIHDRDVDWLLALPLLAVAAFFATAVAGRIGPRFTDQHLGLLTVPVLLAAAIVIGFGTRAMWRLRLPLGLLMACLLPLPAGWSAVAVGAASRMLLGLLALLGSVGSAGSAGPIPGDSGRAPDPTTWLTGLAGPASLLVTLALLGAVVGRRVLPVAVAWAVLAVLRTLVESSLGAAVPGPVADLGLCLGVLAAAVLVVRRVGRAGRSDVTGRSPEPGPADPAGPAGSGRPGPITRSLQITGARLRGAAGE